MLTHLFPSGSSNLFPSLIINNVSFYGIIHQQMVWLLWLFLLYKIGKVIHMDYYVHRIWVHQLMHQMPLLEDLVETDKHANSPSG